MRSHILIALTIVLVITACGTKTIMPPYDINSPTTLIVWCPSDVCPNSRFYLNTAHFTNDTPLTFDNRLLVYHGAYCTILETRTVDEYLWTDENYEQTHLSEPVDVLLVECDNRFRRKGDSSTEYIDGSYITEGWIISNTNVISISGWDSDPRTP